MGARGSGPFPGNSHEGLAQSDVYKPEPRPEVAAFIPTHVKSALDVGCGPGGFGKSLRAAIGSDAIVWGIDPVAKQAEVARRDATYDRVLVGYFPEVMVEHEQRFDLICFNDVLEHILEPGEVLAHTSNHLTPTGRVLASIPNIQYLPIIRALLKGRWDYTDEGTLDRTHVRFFTRATIVELFEDNGFQVEQIEGVNSMLATPRYRLFRRGLSAILGNSQYLQFVVVAGRTVSSPST